MQALIQETHCGLFMQTGLRAGNLGSSWCHTVRDFTVLGCWLRGWPQTDRAHEECAGQNIDRAMIECLYDADEDNWWTAFPNCSGPRQCYDHRPAYTKLTPGR
jgi:hypothetical protein